MELEQLRHFVKVAELQNFTRAADQIGLSQPALSRSVARLEAAIGQPLFERQTRKVALTDAGHLLFQRAQRILLMVDDLKAELRDDGESGRVRVGAIPTVAPYLLPAILQSFQHQFPRAQVIVQEDTTENLLKKISDGEIDVALAALPIQEKYVDVTPLFVEELLLVTSEDHPLVTKKSIRIQDLEDFPFVLLGEAHCLSDNVVTFCRQKSIHPVSVERTCQLAMVQELVALGHGISLVPEMARERDTSKSRRYRSLTGPKPTRTIVMISNPYRYQSRLMRGFLDHLKRDCAPKANPVGRD